MQTPANYSNTDQQTYINEAHQIYQPPEDKNQSVQQDWSKNDNEWGQESHKKQHFEKDVNLMQSEVEQGYYNQNKSHGVYFYQQEPNQNEQPVKYLNNDLWNNPTQNGQTSQQTEFKQEPVLNVEKLDLQYESIDLNQETAQKEVKFDVPRQTEKQIEMQPVTRDRFAKRHSHNHYIFNKTLGLGHAEPEEYEHAIERWGDAYDPDKSYDQYEKKFSGLTKRQTTEEKELREELTKPDTICSTKGYIILAVVLILTALLIIFWAQISKPVIDWMTGKLKKVLELHPVAYYSILFGILFVWMIMPVPGLNLFCMIMALAFQEFWQPFFLQYTAHLAASTAIYLMTKHSLRRYLLRKFSENIFYKFLLHSSKKSPLKIALSVRFIEIIEPYKNVMLTLAKVQFR